ILSKLLVVVMPDCLHRARGVIRSTDNSEDLVGNVGFLYKSNKFVVLLLRGEWTLIPEIFTANPARETTVDQVPVENSECFWGIVDNFQVSLEFLFVKRVCISEVQVAQRVEVQLVQMGEMPRYSWYLLCVCH